MKTTLKILTPVVAIVLITVACGNTSSKPSKEEVQEITPETKVDESVKQVSDNGFDFENYVSGQLPEGWSQYYTGPGGTDWKVVDDNGNKTLAQLYSDNPNGHFNIIVNDAISMKDMTLTVRLRGVTGKHDQGGGFIWRFTDKDNYYVVRSNPLEDNVVLYKVEKGKRTDLPLIDKGRTYGVDVPAQGDSWHTMKLTVKGDLFTVFLDGNELFKVQDSTFSDAGKVGLWTKADAVTYFDDFIIE
jgi:hypothetical protein